MTEQQQTQPTIDEVELTPELHAALALRVEQLEQDLAAAQAAAVTETPTKARYAAYNTRHARFVEGVHDSKTKARAAVKDLEGDFEIREV